MPIYEYKCEHGHVFEVMQRMSDDPLLSCQTCEAPVRRVLHPVAVHFKGSGFYNTDYGTRKRAREESTKDDDAPKKDSGSETSGAETKKDAGSDTKKESKPEPKASTASTASD